MMVHGINAGDRPAPQHHCATLNASGMANNQSFLAHRFQFKCDYPEIVTLGILKGQSSLIEVSFLARRLGK
jgi:hypothetical protein